MVALDPGKLTRFKASDGLMLVADEFGIRNSSPSVVLLHGGGQTRHSWGNTAACLAGAGRHVVSLDARGHGESDWSQTGDYTGQAHANDLAAVLSQLPPKPALVGASMGGVTAMRYAAQNRGQNISAIVLVDIAPKTNPKGIERIRSFMTSNPHGFGDLDEVADSIASYLPHRKRRMNTDGLSKNLRRGADGRLYWHWDPRFMQRSDEDIACERAELERLTSAIEAPVLMVRGGDSDVVDEAGAAHLQELIPHAEIAVVSGARHMVAGDNNDAFNEAIFTFLNRHMPDDAQTAGALI